MENYSNEEIKKKLLRAKKAELVTLIKDLVDGDPSLTEKVLVFLSSASTPNKHKTLIYRYINRFCDQGGHLRWEAKSEVANYLASMMDTLYEEHRYGDLIGICPHIIAGLNYQLLYVDDSYAELSSVADAAIQYIAILLERENLNSDLRKELLHNLEEILQDRDIYAFDYGRDIWTLMSNLVDDDDEYQNFIAIMNDHIETLDDNWIRSYNIENMLYCQIHSLDRLEHKSEMEALIEDNLHLNKVRKLAVEICLRNADFDGALVLIDEVVGRLENESGRPDLTEWEKLRLVVFEQKGDQSSILTQAKHNLINHDFDLSQFQMIKSMTNPDNWLETRDYLISQFKQKGNNRSEYSLIEIYHEEEMWKELLETVATFGYDFYILDKYCDELIKYDKDAVLDLYCVRIVKFAESHVGRKYYKVLARYLRKLRKWGAHNRVLSLVESLRKEYWQRRALIDELKEF